MMYIEEQLQNLLDRILKIQKDVEDIKECQNGTSEEEWMNNNDVCRIFKIGSRTLVNYRRNGVLPFHRLNGKILYRKSEIESVLMEHKATGSNQDQQ